MEQLLAGSSLVLRHWTRSQAARNLTSELVQIKWKTVFLSHRGHSCYLCRRRRLVMEWSAYRDFCIGGKVLFPDLGCWLGWRYYFANMYICILFAFLCQGKNVKKERWKRWNNTSCVYWSFQLRIWVRNVLCRNNIFCFVFFFLH